MVRIEVDTVISAPIQTCFDLARSLSAHVATTTETGEKVVSTHTSDLLVFGDEVTFEAKHLGFRRQLTGRIVEFDEPTFFADWMVKGSFQTLRHEHRFVTLPSGDTKMTDVLVFLSPFGFIGRLFDRIYLSGYMERFIRQKGVALKALAEKQVNL